MRLHTTLSRLRDDPITFMETVLVNRDGSPFRLHDAQKAIIHGIKPTVVAQCGRQFGKSVVYGGYGTWFGATHENREVYVIAPTVDQSRIIFDEIANHFRRAPLNALVAGKIKEYPFPRIDLINGTRLHGRGANNPQFIRGKPVHLALLDEAAFFKQGVIPNVIEPMFTVTRRTEHAGLLMISTPFGQGDFEDYAAMARKNPDDMAFFHFTSYDNPYADRKYLDRIKEERGEESLLWQTEYMANSVSDDLAVFPWAQIKRAMERYHYDNFPLAPIDGHRYVSGVDLANVRDYFVQTVLDTTDPSLVPLVHMDRMQKRGYGHYKKTIRQTYQTFHHPRTLIDATSLGESVVEDLSDISAEGYKFSSQSKYEVVQELSRMFAENRLALPSDRTILDELRYFQYEITQSKKLKMEARYGHDDIVMSLALAAHLALLPRHVGLFAPVNLSPKVQPVTVTLNSNDGKYYDPFKALFEDEE